MAGDRDFFQGRGPAKVFGIFDFLRAPPQHTFASARNFCAGWTPVLKINDASILGFAKKALLSISLDHRFPT